MTDGLIALEIMMRAEMIDAGDDESGEDRCRR